MRRVNYIDHQGKKILYLDLSGINSDNMNEFREAIQGCKEIVKLNKPLSTLVLTTVKGSHSNIEMIQMIKDLTTQNKPYIKASATVGIDGIKRAIFQAVNKFSGRDMKTFDNEEDAKNFLASK